MELVILVLAPTMVVVTAVVHAWATPETKMYSLLALIFMSMMADVTCCVHFVIVSVSDQAAVADAPWRPFLLSFTWPSIAYALDTLAWDLFYGVAALFAAAVFRGDRLSVCIRALLVVSGVLSIAGVSGVVVGNMQLRMLIGVTGYAVLFPVAGLFMTRVFQRTKPISA